MVGKREDIRSRMRFERYVAAIWLGASAWGCTIGSLPIRYTPTNAPPRPMVATPPEKLQVFMGTTPSTPHVEVALLDCGELCSGSSEADVLPFFRKEASKRGCDAIVLSTTSSVNGTTKNVYTHVIYKATCLVWVEAKSAAPVGTSAASSTTTGSKMTCLPGEGRACVGPGGCSGGQVCNADGMSLGPCDCGETSPKASSP